jgi:antibiotic biosynthesis monooxygenase (ABM) superfamily enzyme
VSATPVTGSPSAVVVVTQRLTAENDAAYQQWQAEVDAAAAACEGFLGSETTPATAPGHERERSVVYRFDTTEHLRHWLDSGSRRELLTRGAHLFEEPPSQQVLVDRDEEPVTVVVNHRVDPADEPAFTAWQQRVTAVERTFAGFRGSDLLRPVPGIQEEWVILTTFDTTAHLEDWLGSPERRAVLAEGGAFGDFSVRRIASPYGSWFGGRRGSGEVQTPDWKTAVSVLVGLYPTVVLLTLALARIWPNAPLWGSLLVGNVLSVSVLTWLVMPNVTRILRFWLVPDPPGSRRNDLVGLGLSLGFLTVAAVVFWLATTVIWTLP